MPPPHRWGGPKLEARLPGWPPPSPSQPCPATGRGAERAEPLPLPGTGQPASLSLRTAAVGPQGSPEASLPGVEAPGPREGKVGGAQRSRWSEKGEGPDQTRSRSPGAGPRRCGRRAGGGPGPDPARGLASWCQEGGVRGGGRGQGSASPCSGRLLPSVSLPPSLWCPPPHITGRGPHLAANQPVSLPSCWLSLEGGLLYAFVGPAAAVVLVRSAWSRAPAWGHSPDPRPRGGAVSTVPWPVFGVQGPGWGSRLGFL